jgi:RNA polymerase sigma-70 factor, ECF subfamily
MDQPPDDLLAKQARHDPLAFSELYKRHVTTVYRYLLARLGNQEDAQDLTTETFMAALENIDRYRLNGKFRPWLLGIARHKVADFYERNRHTFPLEMAESVPDPDPLPDDHTQQVIQLERVVELIKRLTPERAEAISLRIWGGLSAAEIGDIMGKSEAAVKMLVHRAWQDLRLATGGEELL